MKKLYKKNKFKRFNAKKVRKSIKKRRLQNLIYIEPPRPSTEASIPKQVKSKQRQWKTISPPDNFSIADNPNDTLEFFEKLDTTIKKGFLINLALDNITNLTGDSILYLLSRLDYYKKKYSFYHLSGSAPLDKNCKDLFTSSGFYNYVNPINFTPTKNQNIFSIESGEKVETKTARAVKNYAHNCSSGSTDPESKSTYATIIECMANTNNHAYKTGSSHPKWWLMAKKVSPNCTQFIFLDNGAGIPKTITTKLLGLIPLQSDVDIIKDALQGKFNSRTKLKWRGKGLPKIYKFFQNNKLGNLKVVSGNGFFDCAPNKSIPTKKTFYGTMLIWEFKSQGVNNGNDN